MANEKTSDIMPVNVCSPIADANQDVQYPDVPGTAINYRKSDGELVDDDGNVVSHIDIRTRDRMREQMGFTVPATQTDGN